MYGILLEPAAYGQASASLYKRLIEKSKLSECATAYHQSPFFSKLDIALAKR